MKPMKPMNAVTLLPLCAVVLTGCLSDLSIPKDAHIACEKGDECPGGLVCAESIGRCVDPALVNLDAVVVTVDGTPARSVISDVEPFHETTVSFLTTRAPRGFESRANAAKFPCTDEDADDGAVRFTCTVTAPPARADGEMSVFGFATDELGAETNAWVSVTIDRAPPVLLEEQVGVEHVPADDNPRAGTFTLASTYGGTVRLALAFDEPVTLSSAKLGALDITDVPAEPALAFVLRTTLPRALEPGADALTDGALDVTLTATDAVGNVSDVTLEDLVAVDVTAPAALAAGTDAFVLRRTPWGAAEDVGGVRAVSAPHTEVRVSAAAVPDDVAAVRVSQDGVPAAARPVDRMGPSFDIPLVGDVRVVDVEAVDEAGNVSPSTRVAHVDWIASLAGKVAGSSFENPHVAFVTGTASGALSPRVLSEIAAPGALVVADGDAHEAEARRAWRRVGMEAPTGRGGAAFVFDDVRGRVVSTNGLLAFGPGSETMELVGDRWVVRGVDAPPSMKEMAGAFDRARGVTVVFGGDSFYALSADTWEFDGAAWTRRETSVAPAARHAAAMAYDAARGVTVLFGGRGVMGTIFGDTWEWDGVRWTETTPASGGPPARRNAAMAWDEANQRLVLHGGGGDVDPNILWSDTWVYQDGAWSELGAPTGRGRDAPAMTYDPVRGRMVMFGGTRLEPFNPNANSDFVELLDDDTWATIPDPFSRPPDRWLGHMATDLAGGRVILYGGRPENYFDVPGSYAVLEDTWIWDGATWTELIDNEQYAIAPAAIANDPATGGLVTYGGALYGGGVGVTQETLVFNGRVWLDDQSISEGDDPPTPNAVLAPFDGGLALVELNSDATRQWYGYSWYTFTTAPNLTAPVAMAQAPLNMGGGQSALLTGGGVGDRETWLLSDATYTWSRVCDGGAGQSCPGGQAMTFDVLRGVAVAVDDTGTWEHDGAQWTLRADVTTPTLSDDAQATFDETTGRVLVYTGDAGDATIYEYDGAAWFHVPALDAPARPNAVFAYDPRSGEPLLVGGLDAGFSVDETWALSQTGRPGQLLQFAFGAAGGALELLEARLDVVAGGSGPEGDGVAVHAWSDGRFVALASSTDPRDAPAALRASATGATLSRMPYGEQRALVFLVASASEGAARDNISTVALDEATLTVRYRLP